jgi:hypothetical protein
MPNSSQSTKISISDLDFDGIKNSLQSYLSAQPEWTDYSFEGSGLSVILNILSYNTHYLSYYLNMCANEMFLDSADRRESIISIAKTLGYTPRSRKSAQALINIVITPPGSPTPPATLTLDKNTGFNSSVNGVTYTFVTLEATTATLTASKYTFNNVIIQEGIPYTYKYVVNNTTPVKYIIPNSGVDTSTLVVRVQDSAESALITTFNLASDLNVLDNNTNAYFLQEVDNSNYEVYFGDGILGKLLQDGNIVYLDYVNCNGDAANFANIFTPSGTMSGLIQITTINAAAGGSERETQDSVRFSAPKNYQTQNRAVTAGDYKTIITREYPNVSSVAVWGGETNVPPQYGKVFLSLKPVSGYVITQLTKQMIVTNILQRRNIVSIIPVVIDPDYIFLMVNSLVKYNAPNTNKTADQIKSLVLTTIHNFALTNIDQFESIFRYTQLTGEIDSTEPSITNNLTQILMKKYFTPRLNITDNYPISFENAITPSTLSSSAFIDTLDSTYAVGQQYFFDDDGLGTIRTYKFVGPTKTYTKLISGTINYSTGSIVLTNFRPSDVVDVSKTLSIIVQPLVNDIIPVRNNIIVIDDSDVTVNMQVNSVLS